ncbi:acid protease [Gyrodon lividus]|nr:acid protease [Gyrodon lividus]
MTTDPSRQLSHRCITVLVQRQAYESTARFSVLLQTSLPTMRFTLATVITALPFFIAAVPQLAKQRGTAIPLSKLSSLVNADESVDSEALNSHIASTTAKILHGFDNFEKNTGASHPLAVKGVLNRDSDGLPLASLGDHLNRWFGTISVGTPPRNFAGIDCDYSCDGHTMYDPKAFSTSIELGKTFSAQFGGGDRASGHQYNDNVTTVGLTATHQTLGAALHYSEGFQIARFAGDGLLGMGFQAFSHYDQSPFFQTLIAEGQTDEPVFAFSFAAPGPELYLGGTNPDMYTGDFIWTPATQQNWQVNIDSIAGNGRNVLTNVPAIIDTGTILIFGNPSEVAALYAAIGGTPLHGNPCLYSFPCRAVPSVGLTFSGTSFPIPAENLNIGFDYDNPSQCVGAIAAWTFPFWLVGTRFLSSVYTAFDPSNELIGFATLA